MVRLPSSCLRRGALTYITGIQGRHILSSNQARLPQWLRVQQQRCLHSDDGGETQIPTSTSSTSLSSSTSAAAPTESQQDTVEPPAPDPRWDAFKQSFHFQLATSPHAYRDGKEVNIHGFLGKRRDKGTSLSFCALDSSTHAFQIVSTWKEEGSLQHTAHQQLKEIPSYSPVCVTGTLVASDRPVSRIDHPNPVNLQSWDLRLRSIQCLNPFPKDIIVSKDAVWSPAQRHLQLRFDPLLRQRLHLRSVITTLLSHFLKTSRGFEEVETPLLFKSTPEGAREFLVPTRRKGYAYALPQSPQQYKQILMAAGLPGYFQFAKCFRDEDHRADRQPEFTQLDLEMSFATGKDVRLLVESLIRSVFKVLNKQFTPTEVKGIWHPVYDTGKKVEVSSGDADHSKKTSEDDKNEDYDGQSPTPKDENEKETQASLGQFPPDMRRFPKMSYDYAMRNFGSDKPDLRITPRHASNITRIESSLPEEFIKMITSLPDPIVEAVKFRFNNDVSPRQTADFIREFADAIPNTPGLKLTSPGSTPGIFVFDSSKPISGLSALGHEAGEHLASLHTQEWKPCRDGDVIIIHARENTGSDFRGSGSTDLGRLRAAVHDSAQKKGNLITPARPVFRPVWITDFPLFTPNSTTTTNSGDEEDPGQGGTAGFSSTHHPFTAPLRAEDFDLLRTDPLKAKADHYDLVINGVEVGGGSRRIHVAEMQEYVLRDVLGMDDAGVGRFGHLLEALRAGCPPHAGFAFGFDRLLTILCDVPSVRDVIAFPKNNKGEDPLVGSPSKTSAEQQRVYHLFRTE